MSNCTQFSLYDSSLFFRRIKIIFYSTLLSHSLLPYVIQLLLSHDFARKDIQIQITFERASMNEIYLCASCYIAWRKFDKIPFKIFKGNIFLTTASNVNLPRKQLILLVS